MNMRNKIKLFLICFFLIIIHINTSADEVGPKVIYGGQRDMIWPVPSSHSLTSCFYDQRNVSSTYPYGNHFAIDIGGAAGANIVASYGGTVEHIYNGCAGRHTQSIAGDPCGLFGNCVVLRHSYRLLNGNTISLYTRYSHMSSVNTSLKVGDTVSAGSVIGYVGTTGYSDGNHCDFQILEAATSTSWQDRFTYSRDPFANELLELPSDIISYDGCAYGDSYLAKIKAIYATPIEDYSDMPNPIYKKSYWGPETATTIRPIIEIKNPETVEKVTFAVWTTDNQSDLKWLDANSNGAGSWYLDINVADFVNSGFNCHAYVQGKNGKTRWYILTVDYPDPVYKFSRWEIKTGSTRRPLIAFRNPDMVDEVTFAVWTTENQSDLQWIKATPNGYGSWYCDFNVSDFASEGFLCHAYVTGKNGNVRWYILTVDYPDPICKDSYMIKLDETKIRPVAEFSNPDMVEKVTFAIWTTENQSDIQWLDAYPNGYGSWFYDNLPVADFTNRVFNCHIYIRGTNASEQVVVMPQLDLDNKDKEPPVITDVEIIPDAAGYTINCKVSDNTGVTAVHFPTWTLENGQDDLDLNWMNNNSTLGTYDPQTEIATYRVERQDHNNEVGEYETDIYANDAANNGVMYRVYYTFEQDHSITYHLDGGINAENNPDEFAGNTPLTLEDPTKDYYDFQGWYLSETGNEKFQNGQTYDHDLDLYARWKKTEYDITLYVNHEVDPNTGVESWVRKVTYGDPFGELPVPEWEGYTFTGWFTAEVVGTQITAESIYTGVASYYAHWVQNPVHITFDGNKVFTASLEAYARDKTPGETYGSLPEITAQGYDFLGWFTQTAGGTEITAETIVTMTDDHTLYAHWEAKEYTLSFDVNMSGMENPASRKIRYKEAFGDLPTCSSDDYDFLGWFDAADGSRKFTSTSVYNYTTNLTVYAKWMKKEMPHEHAYSSEVTTEPSCTEPGVRTYTCECGDTYTEEIPAKGHTPEDTRTGVKEASCTENGYTGDILCRDCKTVLERGTIISKTGHQHTTVRDKKDVSCTEDGYTGDTWCIDCDTMIEKGEVITAPGHDWIAGDIIKEVTCTEAGEQEYSCSRCNETKTEPIPVSGHLGNTIIRFVKAATCTEDGYTGDSYCNKCYELIKKGETIPATGHQHIVVLNEKAATCSTEGYTGDTYCIVCETLVQEGTSIPKTEHQHTTVRDTKEATCSDEGYTGDTWCIDCETLITEGRSIAKLEHSWDDGVVTKEATATAAGTKTFTCTACGETKEEVIPPTGEVNPTEPDKPTEETEKPEQKPAAPTPAQTTETDQWGNKIVSEQQMESTVLAMTTDNDPAGSTFSLLQAKVKKAAKTSITISWKRVPGASSYTVYGNKCGKGNKYQKIATVNGGQYVHKGLKKGTYYKFLIVANGGGKAKAVSKTIHAATTGGKVGNNKSVKITSKKTVTLKKGKTSKIKAKAVAKSSKLKVKKHRKLAYETDNPKVATVNKSGKIKAVGKGTCNIYIYTQDGISAKVKVKVKG